MHYFIVNPKSSSGKGLRIWNLLEEQLIQDECIYEVFFTKKVGHASRLAELLSTTKAPCTIVAVGGDGTANEVVNGLRNYHEITFGYIPSGSGNDLARGLGLAFAPLEALHTILHPSKIEYLNIGKTTAGLNSRNFIVSSGIGFDAAVCHEALHSPFKSFFNKLHLGKLTYVGIAVKQLITMKTFPLELVLDDNQKKFFPRTYFVAFMNLKYEGGGFMFCPDALPDDDLLDICVIEKLPKFIALCLLPAAFKGKHLFAKGVHTYQCKKAKVTCPLPHHIHTDGESWGHAPCLTFQLEEELLPVIIS